MPVGGLVGQVHAAHADPAQGLGFPAARPVPDPGQLGQRRRPAEHQVGQRAGSQVGGGHAVPDVPAGPTQPRGRVEVDRRLPVPRHGQHTTPAVRDRHVGDLRQDRVQRLSQPRDGASRYLTIPVESGTEPVGHAASADGDPVVDGPLGVEEPVRGVAERLPALPADVLPDPLRDGFGGDHRAVHRQPAASQPGQPGGESLGGAQHDRRAHGAPRRGDATRADLGRRRALVQVDPQALHGVGQSACQRGGLDPGTVRVVVRGKHSGKPDALRRFARGESRDSVDAPPALGVGGRGQPGRLRRVTRDLEGATLDDAGVDVLPGGDVDHLVDSVVEGTLPGHDGVAAVLTGHPLAVSRNESGQPAPVASGGAEPGEPGLEHHDAQRRVGLFEVVGGPQAGVARTDDADVGVPAAG